MDRRTFILLTSAASVATFRRPVLQRPRQAPGRLRFDLDNERRWSLSYLNEGQPVPLIRDATLGAWVTDRFIALNDLEYSAVGTERPSGGEVLRFRGRGAGVYLEAAFYTSLDAPLPVATVSLSIYPDRELPGIGGVRFLEVPATEVLPANGPLVALVEARDSRGAPQVVSLPLESTGSDLHSHGVLGLSRGDWGLGFAFDPTDPGAGAVRLASERIEAASEWTPPRQLRAAGEVSRLRLCFDPSGDGLTALRALFAPTTQADRARLGDAAAPAGWSPRGLDRAAFTEDDVLANADICTARLDPRFCHLITLSDGYQRSLGDWEANDRFPHGHRWLTDQLHSRELQAALWIAPLAVSEGSQVFKAHPDWLVGGGKGAPQGAAYSLDPANPAAREWLSGLARRAVQEWGYDCLELDLLGATAVGDLPTGGLTHAEAYRLALSALRDGAGTETVLIGADSSFQHSVGLVNAMRIVPVQERDVELAARATALRSFYHRGAWLNEAGDLLVGPPVTRGEAELHAAIAAVSGTPASCADDLRALPPDRLEIVARTLPVAAPGGSPIRAMDDEPGVAPALVTSAAVYPIPSPWRFRTGDDARYAARDYDEAVWETLPVPAPWAATGHAGYTGYAWYRARFDLPSRPSPGVTAHLELGRVDGADETYVNGVSVGGTGAFPPSPVSARDTFRQYVVPADALNWGGENVLALRVYGGEGGGEKSGGIWSVRRERPPRVWVAEGAPRWWTVVLANWDADSAEISVALRDLGIVGTGFDAYDVWRNVPLPAITDVVRVTVAARSSATIALRPAAQQPQVIGTSRHVLQGAIDVTDETWDSSAATLRGRATRLDRRAYSLAIAVPPDLNATTCEARAGGAALPCTLRRLESGHAVLEWGTGAASGDVQWTVSFVRPARETRRKPSRP